MFNVKSNVKEKQFRTLNFLQCFLKQIDPPSCVAATTDHCVIAVEYSQVTPKDPNILVETHFKDKKYQLLVCNAISTTVDCKCDERL